MSAHKCSISLPDDLWHKAHQRQLELGYGRFSHYLQFLVRADARRHRGHLRKIDRPGGRS